MHNREEWSSKLGFILAASGSAIGLGNIWRFPYITGANGGGAFVLIYLICVFVVAFPIMIVELVIGRKAKKNPVGAFKIIAPGSKWWIIGAIGVIAGFGILSYYSVVAGWTLAYIVKAVSGGLIQSSQDPASIFNHFAKNGVLQISYLFIFSAITVFVVIGGIKDGIEKAAKILLPILFILMLLLIGYVLTLPHAMEGVKFYLIPDFSKVTSHTILMAMGQAFFSLSLGMGAMITYGSYLPDNDDLFSSAFYVTFFDTLIAILSGFIIYPALGGAPSKSGPSLVFVVLVDVFKKIPFGEFIAIVFFILMAIAALTSTVSLLEVVTSYLIDEKKIERKKAAIGAGIVIALLGIPSAISLGANKFFTKLGFLDKMDFVFGNIFLTFGGLMMCLFVAYRWGLKCFFEHLSEGCDHVGKPHFNGWLKLAIYFICPLAIAILLLYLLITGQSLG